MQIKLNCSVYLLPITYVSLEQWFTSNLTLEHGGYLGGGSLLPPSLSFVNQGESIINV